MAAKYFGGCDLGSTYCKTVILDDSGKMVGHATTRSSFNPEETAKASLAKAMENIAGLDSYEDLAYLVGTGYGRNKINFAQDNVSEISCHAMGVHVTNPKVDTIIDVGGQDVKGIGVDEDGTVAEFAMNDKCAAGTGRFFENMAKAFEVELDEFSELSLKAKKVVPITSQCSVFAESEVISLIADNHPKSDIVAGIHESVAKRCVSMLRKVGINGTITMTGGCAKNEGLRQKLAKRMRREVVKLDIDPQLIGALGAAEYARKKAA